MQLDFTMLLTPDASLWQSPLLPHRFWAKVNLNGPLPPHCPELGPCWVWTAYCKPNGYGAFRSYGRMVYTHRLSYTSLVAPIPEGQDVCHRCDNRPCVRPGHLFVGTRAENMADCARKGRGAVGERNGSVLHPERVPRGERVGSAKLTTAKVLEMRRLARAGVTLRAIASRFGVDHTTVWQIVRLKSWAHV